MIGLAPNVDSVVKICCMGVVRVYIESRRTYYALLSKLSLYKQLRGAPLNVECSRSRDIVF